MSDLGRRGPGPRRMGPRHYGRRGRRGRWGGGVWGGGFGPYWPYDPYVEYPIVIETDDDEGYSDMSDSNAVPGVEPSSVDGLSMTGKTVAAMAVGAAVGWLLASGC